MKIARNDPCPCGSGKKYKKCHGGQPPAPNVLPPVKAELPILGLSGYLQWITSVPRFADPKDPRNQGGPRGLPGAYKVTFTFSRPGFPLTAEYQCADATHIQGDSHLAIAKPALHNPANPDADQIRIATLSDDGSLEFIGYPNPKGFLCRVETTVQAADFIEARRRAYKALAPALSNWAAHFDIPLNINQIDIREERTGAVRFSFLTPFPAMPLNVQAKAPLTRDFRGYVSLYREALNSNSDLYQFLCYYKIIESIRERRTRLAQEARRGGRDPRRRRELYPNDRNSLLRWLSDLFPAHRGTWDELALEMLLPEEAKGSTAPDFLGHRFGLTKPGVQE